MNQNITQIKNENNKTIEPTKIQPSPELCEAFADLLIFFDGFETQEQEEIIHIFEFSKGLYASAAVKQIFDFIAAYLKKRMMGDAKMKNLIEKIQQNQAEIAADLELLKEQEQDFAEDIEAIRQRQIYIAESVEVLKNEMQADIETKEVDNNGN